MQQNAQAKHPRSEGGVRPTGTKGMHVVSHFLVFTQEPPAGRPRCSISVSREAQHNVVLTRGQQT